MAASASLEELSKELKETEELMHGLYNELRNEFEEIKNMVPAANKDRSQDEGSVNNPRKAYVPSYSPVFAVGQRFAGQMNLGDPGPDQDNRLATPTITSLDLKAGTLKGSLSVKDMA